MKYTEKNIRNFWNKVDKQDIHKCWEWIACRYPNGYGSFGINGVPKYAHRVSWELTYGDVPDGMCILHTCDNPNCVNPAHLFLVTHNDNIQDKVAKGRQSRFSLKGEQAGNAKLTWEQVNEIRSQYAAGGITQTKLAKEFRVHQTLIGFIVRNERWR